jgi:hypothetical protein
MEERLRARFATLENLIASVQSTNLDALYA